MVMGLGLTFIALGLFIGLIVLLERLFPPKPKAATEAFETQSVVSQMERDTADEEIAAAIAIALAHVYSHELCRSDLGVDLEKGHGPWWVGGRLDQSSLGSLSIRGRIE